MAVIVPTIIKVMTARMEVVDRDAAPLIPCPEVHPLERRVPKPTKKPPNASRHHWIFVNQNPSDEIVIV